LLSLSLKSLRAERYGTVKGICPRSGLFIPPKQQECRKKLQRTISSTGLCSDCKLKITSTILQQCG
jgi:hypothetical protein